MSFGYGVGDFLAVLKLANDLRGRFSQAPKEYKAITDEVESLILALQHTNSLDEKEFDHQQKQDLNKISQGCQNALQDLEAQLNKLHILADDSTPDWKSKVRQSWKRIRWDQTEINNYRSRIVSNILLLNLIISNVNKQRIQRLNQQHEDQERDKILSWLSQASSATRQSEVFNSHQKGTGSWLLQTTQFQQWITGQEHVLFCPGIPGSGKTVLSSIIIDHLEQMFPDEDEVGIAYLFCDYRQQHSLLELYSALLRQAVQRKRSLPQSIKSFYETFSTKATQPSEEDVLRELRAVLSPCTRAFVVIDALDECPVTDGDRSIRHRFLRELVRLQNEVGFNLLATSRPDGEIAAHFEQGVSVEIKASKEDIRYYVDVRLEDLPSFVRKRPNLKQSIKEGIAEAAKDMFLLARLYFNLLLAEANEKGIRKMLDQFRTGSQSNAYDHAYNETMSRVERQGGTASDLAKKTIGWIINARRILTAAELEHALAVEVNTSEFDETNITDIEQLTAYCCGLVIVDEQTTRVRLVHYTTQKYFEATWRTWFPDILELVVDSCLTYISYDVFEDDRFETEEEVKTIADEYPFYNYSSLNWGHHFREWPGNQSMALRFFQSETKVLGYDRLGFNPSSWEHSPGSSGLRAEHVAACFDLEHLMLELLEKNPYHLDIQNSAKQTPLYLAAINGHETMVKLLLDKGSTIDSMDSYGKTPLHAAVERGHVSIAKLLLDSGADIEIRDFTGETPLCAAVKEGRDKAVSLLLDRGANIDTKEESDRTPLHLAANSGHETTVLLLLERGADIQSRSTSGQHPLHEASLNGNLGIVKLFVDKGISPNIVTTAGETPLHMVTSYLLYRMLSRTNQETFDATFEFLLESGADTELKNDDGETPLHCTARKRFEVSTRLLLRYGAYTEARNNDNDTPLHLAAGKDSIENVQTLLDHGAFIDSLNNKRQSPLHLAILEGTEETVHLLLDKKANIHIGTGSGNAPLSYAAWRGLESIIQLLLDKGASPNPSGCGPKPIPSSAALNGHTSLFEEALKSEGNADYTNVYGRSPLHMASAGGHILAAKLLLKAGAKPDTQDRFGRTPLFLAVCGGHLAMAEFLLSLPGVEKNQPDIWGLISATEAQKRGFHELSALLSDVRPDNLSIATTSSSAENTSSKADEGPKTSICCDVCLVHFADEEERYTCEDFDSCALCPPAEEGVCPVCGGGLERKVAELPRPRLDSLDDGCICM